MVVIAERARESFSAKNILCQPGCDGLKHDFRKRWYEEIEDNNKCLLFRHFKATYRRGKRISLSPGFSVFALVKRCIHRLPIEAGRQQNLPSKKKTEGIRNVIYLP